MFMSSLLIAGMFSLEYFLVQLYQQKIFPFSTNHEMFPYFEWRIIKVDSKFLRLGNITWVISLFSPQFSWGIFSSVVHLHQYRGSKKKWWIIIAFRLQGRGKQVTHIICRRKCCINQWISHRRSQTVCAIFHLCPRFKQVDAMWWLQFSIFQ